MSKKLIIKLRNIWEFALLFTFTAGFLITSSWTGDIMQQIIEGKGAYYLDNWFLPLIYFGSWLVFAILIYYNRNRFVPTKTMYEITPSPHRVLIMLVSTPSWTSSISDNTLYLEKTINKSCQRYQCPFTENIEEMIARIDEMGLPSYWNWQQNLRSLAVHQHIVEKVVLIGSDDDTMIIKKKAEDGRVIESQEPTKGSVHVLKDITRLLKHFLPQAEFTDNQESSCKFNNLEDMRDIITKNVNELVKQGYKQKDIIVDVTGGTKTASIAAALATLAMNDVEFQYIPENKNDAKSYNVVNTSQVKLE